MQRKLVLQLAIRASCSSHVLAQKSFQLQFFCNLNLNFICSLDKLRIEISSPIAKSTSRGPLGTSFFASWGEMYISKFDDECHCKYRRFFQNLVKENYLWPFLFSFGRILSSRSNFPATLTTSGLFVWHVQKIKLAKMNAHLHGFILFCASNFFF